MAGEPALDEIQWRSAQGAQEMGGIHTNTILPYFASSPFFDSTSNNATLTTQAMYNPNLFYIIQTREAFEGRLKTMQGLEFMVTHDPSENDTKHDHNGVWVIRKQNRRKRQGLQDELTGINSYFVVGENIYMAPSIGSIVGSRMLSAVTSLTKLFSTASALPDFTPSQGHTYLPPTSKNLQPGSSFQAIQTSKESTPLPGGSTPMAGTQDTTASTKASSNVKPTPNTDYQGLQMLSESYMLSLRYGNEYMDENPIVGEPGSFKLSKSRDPAVTSSMSTSMSTAQSGSQLSKPSTPLKDAMSPLKTTDIAAPTRKSTKGGEKSPTTPGTKEKKARRKSKAAGAGDKTTPGATTPKTTTPK